jgi:hypothetical protein
MALQAAIYTMGARDPNIPSVAYGSTFSTTGNSLFEFGGTQAKFGVILRHDCSLAAALGEVSVEIIKAPDWVCQRDNRAFSLDAMGEQMVESHISSQRGAAMR